MKHTPIELRLCCLVDAGIEQLLSLCCLGENEPKILARTSSTFPCLSIDDVLVTCYQ